jgi:alpha-D-ribose 1-methylphosphonate 5-triphosphate synthase subunit PhnH
VRALGIDPVHDTRRTFRALCAATSRPGTVQETPTAPADHAVLATLVDHEVRTHVDDEDLAAALSRQGRLATAPPTEADVVHTRGPPAWDARDLKRGTQVEPSDGATVCYRVDGLADEGCPGHTELRLSGPGVSGERTLAVGLPATALRALAAASETYPRGVDAVFTSGTRLAAVPRSATVEVV